LNILVTGGAGFIASHVADAYINAGHKVIIVDDLSSGIIDNVNPKAKFYKVDIRDTALEQIFRDGRIDVVNHHAAQMDVRRSVADPLFDASVNIVGTLNILENCLKYGVKKIVFASTGGAVYGEQDYFPADEEHPTRPLSPYGITKLAVEKYLFYYRAVHNINHVILRYTNVYGPRQNPHGEAGVIAIFTSRLLKGEQPVINGDGKQTRDYVYVGDVVRANLLALDYTASNTFNVCTSIETDVNALFNRLNAIVGTNCAEHHGLAKAGEQLRSVCTYGNIKHILGWEPRVTIDDGLRQTVDFFRSRK
jgi:UDP-glucose 4-epimerase